MALLIIILRAALGLALVGVAIAGLVASFMSEGVGCLGSMILFVIFFVFMICESVFGDEAVMAFIGMDTWDFMPVILVCGVGGFLIPETHISGIGTSLAVGYTGLVVTGFLNSTDLAAFSDMVMNVGIVVLLPIVLPMVIIIVAVGLAFRS